MSSFDNVQYENYSVNQDDYSHNNTSLTNNNNNYNSNNIIDTSRNTYSGDDSYPAHSPLNNSESNQHVTISASNENSNIPSNDSSYANLPNMDSHHYNSFCNNSVNNYEDGYNSETNYANLVSYNGFNLSCLQTNANAPNGIINFDTLKHSTSSDTSSLNNSNFNMINLIRDQPLKEVRKTNDCLELSISELSASNDIEEVIESVVGKVKKVNSQNECREKLDVGLEKQGMMHFMQPPDSESIAEATEKHKLNRTRRRTRTKYDEKQLEVLESTFQVSHYPEVSVVDRLSNFLKLSPERIAVWFQNRRARFKRAKKTNGIEENSPINQSEVSMLKEVEELLFSTMGKSKVGDEKTESNVDKFRKKRPGKKPEFEVFCDVQEEGDNESEENASSFPSSNINSNDNADDDDAGNEKNPPKSPEIKVEAIIKHKPIFNPMSYEPSNNNSSNNITMPYSTYNPHEAFSVNNLVNNSSNMTTTTNQINDYYSYGGATQNSQLKLPIYKQDSQDSYQDNSSRTSSPQNIDQDNESNASESLDTSDKHENNEVYNNSSPLVYNKYQYENNQNHFYQQQNMAYYHYPQNYNSNFLQSYYNMTEFHNQPAANASYFPNLYSQFSTNPIPTPTYN